MGQSTSKPSQSKVYEAPEVTVDPTLRKESESWPETDQVRQLTADIYIEEQISKKSYEDRMAARAALERNEQGIPDISDGRMGGEVSAGGTSSLEMRKKVQALHKESTGRPRRGQLEKEGVEAREKLVQCLTENKTQPSNCREAFAAFQKEVTRAEEKIASQ